MRADTTDEGSYDGKDVGAKGLGVLLYRQQRMTGQIGFLTIVGRPSKTHGRCHSRRIVKVRGGGLLHRYH